MKHAFAHAIAAQDVLKQNLEVEPIILDDDAAASKSQDEHTWKRRLSASKASGFIDLD